MTNATRDANNIPTAIGILNTDGLTIQLLKVDPSAHYINVSDGIGGSDHGPDHAVFDDNDVPVLMGTSSADGVTPVVIYLDSNGKLLTKST